MLLLLALLIPVFGHAIETQKLPLCEGYKEIRVPKVFQGAYAMQWPGQADPVTFEVNARGVSRQDEAFYPIMNVGDRPDGKWGKYTEAQLVKQGYCRYTEIGQNADGSVEVMTTIHQTKTGISGGSTFNLVSHVLYSPQAENPFEFKINQGAGILLLWVVPIGGGSLGAFTPAVKLN